MLDRTAVNPLRGYFYQFDYTILELLRLNNNSDIITVEGVEDIDVSTVTEEKAIQCKYYSNTQYNHSMIAKPIRLMLEHFAEYKKGNASKIKYVLRGHYNSGHHKLVTPIDLSTLKTKFLTYTRKIKNVKNKIEHHRELGLSDYDLNEFLAQLLIDINAKDLKSQYNEIIDILKSKYECSETTAEFKYNNSLRVIKELSIKESSKERIISKQDFLKEINTKQILFNEWFLERKGEKEYCQSLRKEYFTNLNLSSFDRFFIFEINASKYHRNELKELLLFISKKWSKITRREPQPFCPFVYIHNLCTNELVELKKELYAEEFLFSDGYDFKGADFNPSSITKQADYINNIKLKIIDKIDFIDLSLRASKRTKELYQFYFHKPFYENNDVSLKHIKIPIRKLSYIKDII